MWKLRAGTATLVMALLAGCSYSGPVHGMSAAPPPSAVAPTSGPGQTEVSTSVNAGAYIYEPCRMLSAEQLDDLQADSGETHTKGDFASCTYRFGDGGSELTVVLSRNSRADTLATKDPIRGTFEETSVAGWRALLLDDPSGRLRDCAIHVDVDPPSALVLSVRVANFFGAGACFTVTEIAKKASLTLQRKN